MSTAAKMILVPTCLDEVSSVALSTALELSPQLSAEVALLHVYQLPDYGYAGVNMRLTPDSLEERAVKARRAIEALAERHGGLRVIFLQGNPAEEILRGIDIFRPYMVVMGTHGRSGLSRLLLGSVAEEVVRMSPVPVVTVKPFADDVRLWSDGAEDAPWDGAADELETRCP